MKKLFGGLNMSWPIVIVFALVAGIYGGWVNSVPLFADTSITDIAVTYEWWVIFAFIIASNTKKWWESALKIFVFFLISQPVFFLTEVLLGSLSADMASYYYWGNWFYATLLTLPGGAIAYLIKREDLLGWVILGLGNTIQSLMGVHYFATMLQRPPYHLVTVLICFASIGLMTWQIQTTKKGRAVTLAINAVVTVAIVAETLLRGLML